MYKLIEKVIKANNLDIQDVLDTCFAICMADHFVGTNRLELSIDKFVCSDDTDWSAVLDLLGVSSVIGTPLPKVQRYRVISDALVICVGREIDGVKLSSEASGSVARLRSLNWRSSNYEDINTVESVLQALCTDTYDFSKIHELEDLLYTYEKETSSWKFDLGGILRSELGKIKLPDKFRYLGNGGMTFQDVDTAYRLICDVVMCTLELEFLKVVKAGLSKNEVMTNLFVNRAIKEVGNIGLGTVSLENSVPRIEFTNGLPEYMQEKMMGLFSRNMQYDIGDLDNVFTLLRHLYTGKVGK